MHPAVRDAPGSQPWKPWPLQSGADVAFLPGEQASAERIARRLFHRTLETPDYAGLAGAPDDARVEVGALRGMLYLEMGDPNAATYRAYYYVRRFGGKIALVNEGFHLQIRRLQGRGLGLHVFYRQARNAAALGIDRIETVAGRGPDENGYYTWPRFGFDGRLPSLLRRRLPIGLDGARSVLDLTDSERGRCWWREHGETIRVAFELCPRSRSWTTLNRYVHAKVNSASGPKRNLEMPSPMSYCNAR